MIDSLEGLLVSKTPAAVTVEVGGVGFLVQIPLSTFVSLPDPGQRVRLLTHLGLREDQVRLYGFATEQERHLFQSLIRVNRVGPGVAMKVLGSSSVGEFVGYVRAGDAVALSKLVKGVGKKTAQRLILELKGELAEPEEAAAGPEQSAVFQDVVKAMVSLGESPASARKLAQKALKKLGPDADVGSLMQQALSS